MSKINPIWFWDTRALVKCQTQEESCQTQEESETESMTDYSEPLSDAPAQLSRLTVLLATRRWVDALAVVDGMLRRLQAVRDWLVVRVEGEK